MHTNRFAQAYLIEVDHFSDVIAGKIPVQVTVEDSINSTRIAEACGKASATGAPVPF